VSLTAVLAIAAGNVAAFLLGVSYGNRRARRAMIKTLDRAWPNWRNRNDHKGDE
jgi:hypothetical protein